MHMFADGVALGASISHSLTLGLTTSCALLLHELPHVFGELGGGGGWMCVHEYTVYVCVYICVCVYLCAYVLCVCLCVGVWVGVMVPILSGLQ